MKTLKLFLEIVLFVDMFVTWFVIVTLGIMFLAEVFKQYYFIRDMNTILETSSNKENLVISIYTILLLIYIVVAAILLSVFYMRNEWRNTSGYEIFGRVYLNRALVITVIMLIGILFAIIAGFRYKFIKFWGNISSIFTVVAAWIPLNLIYSIILNKSKLKIRILTPEVYQKFGQNIFDFSLTNAKLKLVAQNTGRKRDYFRFKGICKSKDVDLIIKRKKESNTLIASFTDRDKWVKLEPQDIMPIESIKKTDLKNFLGLFNETICVLYESMSGKIFSDTINLINFNNSMILLPQHTKHDSIWNIVAVGYGSACSIFWAYWYSLILLYTLSFVLILGIFIWILSFVTFGSRAQVRVAYESETVWDKVQIENETKHEVDLSFILIGMADDDEKVINKQRIVIGPNNVSHVLYFSKNNPNYKIILDNGRKHRVYYLDS